jgi:glycosyltransferase involved in cell wall biosynthesis
MIKKISLFAKLLYSLDKYSCKFSDVVLLDTEDHIEYFVRKFSLPREKFQRVWVGTDEELFYPRKKKKNKTFTVFFHGKYIPLQGVQHIIRAADLLRGQKIKFILLGNGQTETENKRLHKDLNLQNIEFLDYVPYEALPDNINKGDVCLGIFGDTDKAKRVIPNKAFEVLAMGLPLITGKSDAIQEGGMNHKENVYLCEFSNPKSLADAIMYLKKNKKVRDKIAKKGIKLFNEKFSTFEIGKLVKEII